MQNLPIKLEGLDGAAFLFLLSLSLTVPVSGAEYNGTLNFRSGRTGFDGILELVESGVVDGSKLSHSSLSEGKKKAVVLLFVGVWGHSFPEGGEASFEVKDDLDSQRSVNSLMVLDPGEIFVIDERLDDDWPKGGKAVNKLSKYIVFHQIYAYIFWSMNFRKLNNIYFDKGLKIINMELTRS